MQDSPSQPAGASSDGSTPVSGTPSSAPSDAAVPSGGGSSNGASNGHSESFWSSIKAMVKRPVDLLLDRRTFPGEASNSTKPAATPKRKIRVLFVDVGNASRSQMAQAFATIYGFHAESAGTFPSLRVSPEAVAAMADIGIDISGFRPKPLDTSRLEAFDRVITFGDPLPGPYRGRSNVEAWNALDPQGLSVTAYASVRDDLERRIKSLARRYKVRQPDLVMLEG